MKYHNQKTVINGHAFDSKIEGERYLFLNHMDRQGKIKQLELQPEFVLQSAFIHNSKKYQPIKYRADFAYWIGDRKIIEDVKGMRTQVYIIKKKMLLCLYRDIEFYEVTKENIGILPNIR